MNAEHLQEQEEAVVINQKAQILGLLKPQVSYSQAMGWLITLATVGAVCLAFWTAYLTDHRSDKTIMDNELRGLNFRDAEQQDEIGSLRTDLAHSRQGLELWQRRQQVQAAQLEDVQSELCAAQTHSAQLEEQSQELRLALAGANEKIQQLEAEFRVLQEQFAVDDKARAQQAQLIQELQRANERTSKETGRKKTSSAGSATPTSRTSQKSAVSQLHKRP